MKNKKEFIDFLSFFQDGLLNVGLSEPLKQWSEKNIGITSDITRQLYDSLLNENSPQEAIRKLDISMPEVIKRLLILGFENSIIDIVLEHSIKILTESENEIEDLYKYLVKLENQGKAKLICLGCLDEELVKLIKRIEIERAKEVYIGYNDDIFYQKFCGVKFSKFSEPGHPLIYNSFKKWFQENG